MVVLPFVGPPSHAERAPGAEPPATASAAAFGEVLSRSSPTEGALVQPVRTDLSSAQASDALARAWTDAFGEEPPPRTVGILTAQWAHETASGASMYNYNFAGIKGAGPSGFSVAQRTREGFGASEHRIVDRFRAYTTAEEGAADYVKLLAARYPDAVSAAKRGDAHGFVHALKAHGYFTGDEVAYTRSIVALAGADAPDGAGGPSLEAPRLDYQELSAPRFSPHTAGFGAPFVDALAMADELSRTALSIAASPDRDKRSGAT